MQLPQAHSSLEEQPQRQNGGQQQYQQESENSPPDHDFLEQILSTFPNSSWPPSDPGMSPLPLRLGNGGDSVDVPHFKSAPAGAQGVGDAAVQALYNGFVAGSLHNNQHQFHPLPPQNFGGEAAAGAKQITPGSVSNGGSSGGVPQRQRVRARRGQATDPHSIAERLRRERIAERMKSLQELVPNANKTDKASMLDEIIDYVKFLQLQVKVLSMSRLGGAGAASPFVTDIASQRGGVGRNSSSGNVAATNNDNNIAVTEHQVAKLMEDDMGTAMQYLQGKGLCLMPISLATAISTATCHSRNPFPPPNKPPLNLHPNNLNQHPLLPSSGGEGGASSPNMSSLTVHSAPVAKPVDAALNVAKEE